MMPMESLTKYIPLFQPENHQAWTKRVQSEGNSNQTLDLLSPEVDEFIATVYEFCNNNLHFDMHNYHNTFKQFGIEWAFDCMSNYDVTNSSEKTVLALLMGAVRAERFADGTILEFISNGSVLRWLERLTAFQGFHHEDEFSFSRNQMGRQNSEVSATLEKHQDIHHIAEETPKDPKQESAYEIATQARKSLLRRKK